jgi:hypothetical protein
MLRDCCQALIEQKFQAEVASLDQERAAAEVRVPMPDRLHLADQLALVRYQFGVARHQRPVDEGDRPRTLMKDRAQDGTRSIALDGEVWQLQYWCHGQCLLERAERLLGRRRPLEALLSSAVSGAAMAL